MTDRAQEDRVDRCDKGGREYQGGHTLIGGVGHPFLRDVSVGPTLVPALQKLEWPEGVEIYDIHFGPIHVMQWLQEKPGYYSRIILLSGVTRNREPGAVYTYRWNGTLPAADEIQQRVCEAVTGIIGLDNLLIIGEYFGVWPAEVAVIEVEPCEEEFGAELSDRVAAAVPAILSSVRKMALGPLDGLPASPFGVQAATGVHDVSNFTNEIQDRASVPETPAGSVVEAQR
ncbi:MAG: hydrogenase maturation protease [Chloroflexi bacterium]|nr:hydrogenase maturation protease [Chloroflexota bacterium]